MWDGYQPTPTSETLWSHPSENLPFHDWHALPRVPTENGFNDIPNGKCFFYTFASCSAYSSDRRFWFVILTNGYVPQKARAQALVLRLCQFAVSDLFKPPKRKVDHPHRFSIFSKSVRSPAYVARRTPLIRNPVLDYKSTWCNDHGVSPVHS